MDREQEVSTASVPLPCRFHEQAPAASPAGALRTPALIPTRVPHQQDAPPAPPQPPTRSPPASLPPRAPFFPALIQFKPHHAPVLNTPVGCHPI